MFRILLKRKKHLLQLTHEGHYLFPIEFQMIFILAQNDDTQ